jgi:Arc/MetJ-type ribon-helix-helix transcriptional regulator
MAQKRTHVFLPEGLVADIDQFVGKGKRSSFITEIVEREMKRQKLLRAIDEARGCWKDEDHPELKDGSEAWVRQLRSGWDTRLPKDG